MLNTRIKIHRFRVLVAIAALASATAFAHVGGGQEADLGSGATLQEVRYDSAPFQSAGMTLEQAVAMVQARYGARALKFNTVEEDGKRVHYIRLITADKSRVWTVRVDAATGREF